MNYLACRALHHYGNVDGPYRQKAENLYKQLRYSNKRTQNLQLLIIRMTFSIFVGICRSNLISNMYKEYTERGYIWEQYNDQTGRGQVHI